LKNSRRCVRIVEWAAFLPEHCPVEFGRQSAQLRNGRDLDDRPGDLQHCDPSVLVRRDDLRLIAADEPAEPALGRPTPSRSVCGRAANPPNTIVRPRWQRRKLGRWYNRRPESASKAPAGLFPRPTNRDQPAAFAVCYENVFSAHAHKSQRFRSGGRYDVRVAGRTRLEL